MIHTSSLRKPHHNSMAMQDAVTVNQLKTIYTITPHELQGIIKEDETDEDQQSAGTREKQGRSLILEPMEMGT